MTVLKIIIYDTIQAVFSEERTKSLVSNRLLRVFCAVSTEPRLSGSQQDPQTKNCIPRRMCEVVVYSDAPGPIHALLPITTISNIDKAKI